LWNKYWGICANKELSIDVVKAKAHRLLSEAKAAGKIANFHGNSEADRLAGQGSRLQQAEDIEIAMEKK
jgi:hypothetical protein